jgi:hypothetical protein
MHVYCHKPLWGEKISGKSTTELHRLVVHEQRAIFLLDKSIRVFFETVGLRRYGQELIVRVYFTKGFWKLAFDIMVVKHQEFESDEFPNHIFILRDYVLKLHFNPEFYITRKSGFSVSTSPNIHFRIMAAL